MQKWKLGALSLAFLVGCGPKDSTHVEMKVPEVSVPPSPSAFDETFLERLDAEVEAPVAGGKILNASYVLLKDGKRVRTGHFGPHSETNNDTVDDRTIYRIYSMTKVVTAVAMMQLNEQGKFGLDDPVTGVVPEFSRLKVLRRMDANGNPVTSAPAHIPTMRELLTHTAGFGYGSGRKDYVNARFDAEGVLNVASGDELIKAVGRIPLSFEPGSDWQYSIASDIQGVIVERLSGQTLGDYLEANILGPLSMKDTGFWVDEPDLDRLVPLTAWTPETGRAAYGAPLASMARSGIPLQAGGHGLVSTLSDFERFLLMMSNQGELDGTRILKPESVALITGNAMPPAPEDIAIRPVGPGYGLGFGFGVATIEDKRLASLMADDGSWYWDGAAGTWFWVDPENGIVFIGLVQNLSPHPLNLRKRTMEMVYRALN